MMMLSLRLILSAVALLLLECHQTSYNVCFVADAFAAPNNNARGNSSPAIGFGKPKVVKQYTVDNSPEIIELIELLSSASSSPSKITASNNNLFEGLEIGIDTVSGKRGLYATKNFSSKEKIICKIPSDLALALNDPNADIDPSFNTISHAGANYINMYCKNPTAAKQWAPYLNTLPQTVDVDSITPDFFTNDEIELLEFPRIIQRAKQRKEEIQSVATETGLSINELQYATWLVSTHAFPIAIADTPEGEINLDERGQVITKAGDDSTRKWIRVLIPYIDIANHSSDKPNVKLTIIDPEKDDAYFGLEVIRPITAGKEILISKGSTVDSTVELFLNHGIIPSKNPMDTLMLKKGGTDCYNTLQDWTTSLQDDQALLNMLNEDDGTHLRKILQFRIQLKKSYP